MDNNLSAVEVRNAVVVLTWGIVEGVCCVETNCRDYEHFSNLPDAVSFRGMILGKSGWNSDRNVACYQSNKMVARRA